MLKQSSSQSLQAKRPGVLLLNLGTPDGVPGVGPSVEQVRIYLRQFLMDRYVIDIPFPFRWLLVNGIILRNRPEQSAEAYRKIWTENGSPLLHHHLELSRGVSERLGDGFQVEAGMRYGSPSIGSALEKFKAAGTDHVLVVPLYPQFSLAATESSAVECKRWVKANAPDMRLSFFPAFYDSPGFIESFARMIEQSLDGFKYDHLLFSFHGLPERHVKKTDRAGSHCLASSECCERICEANRDCYRAQCFSTAYALARRLELQKDHYSVCFQSRLGRTPWIRPYTDRMYQELAERGVKRIAVVCPAFVADCLETLEEIRIRGREDFRKAGGDELVLVPSLNSSEIWIGALTDMLKKHLNNENNDFVPNRN